MIGCGRTSRCLVALSALGLSFSMFEAHPSAVIAAAPYLGPPQENGETFPDLTLPASNDVATLKAFVAKAKRARPRSPQQYEAMQTAIRDASRKLMEQLKGRETTAEYQQAKLDVISSSVSLMTFVGPEARQKTLEQIKKYIGDLEELSESDVQTGMLAATMLELQPNKSPAIEIYKLLDEKLTDDQREAMQSLRLNIQASLRRLNLLGEKLPFEATTMDETKLATEDFHGKFLLVHFFATWSEPCRLETPKLLNYYDKYHARDLDIVSVSVDAEPKPLEEYLTKTKIPWPVVHDNAEDIMERLQMKLGIAQLPTVMLVNKEGEVVSLEARGAELDRLMQMLFEAPTPAPPQEESASGGTDDGGAADQSKTLDNDETPGAASAP